MPTIATGRRFRPGPQARANALRAMPRFRWTACDSAGKAASGELHAATQADVRAALRARGLFSIRVTACPAARGRATGAVDTARFTRQLGTLLQAGIPLLQAIDLLARGHANPRFASLLSAVRDDIASGSSLAQALRSHPQAFDALYCDLVDAGEAGGVLPQQLDRLARQLEASIALRGRLRAALRYPAVLLSVAAVVLAILATAVIPAFRDVFASIASESVDVDAGLPMLTRLVIGGSDAVAAYWPLLLGMPMLAAAVGMRTLRRSETAQRLRDRGTLRLPVVGGVFRKAVTARWTRTLSTLLQSGLPLMDAMEATAHASGNWTYCDGTRRAARAVASGASLSQALRGAGLFDEMLLQMVQIGEQAGAVDTMLARVADANEREVDEALASMTALLEPLIIVVLGVLIGGMVVAMYLPIFRLAQAV